RRIFLWVACEIRRGFILEGQARRLPAYALSLNLEGQARRLPAYALSFKPRISPDACHTFKASLDSAYRYTNTVRPERWL
ncbi:hypothetical protein OAN00_03805, partial [Pseudomonadales bacterium]|nr:hypothetical protein [Pseudomonadales bacterium]